MTKQRFIFIIDHPQQIALAIGWQHQQKIKKTESCLLVSHHPYWNHIDKPFVEKHFSKTIYFNRPDYSFFLPKQIWYLLQAKNKIKKLRIKSEDKFICFSNCQFIENLFVSNFKNNQKTLIEPHTTFQADNQKNVADLAEILLSKIYNLVVFPFFKMYSSEFLMDKSILKFGLIVKNKDVIKIRRYKIKSTKIYHQIKILKDFNQKIKKISAQETEIHYPFPHTTLNKGKKSLQKIIYLGTPFLTYFPDPQDFIDSTNKCLDFLRTCYQGYQLEYKPHPREKNELQLLNLKNFSCLSKHDSIEMYILKNMNKIHSIFSISSTGTKNALNFGINAYCFFPIFPFEEKLKKFHYHHIGQIPTECFIKSLNHPPKLIFS